VVFILTLLCLFFLVRGRSPNRKDDLIWKEIQELIRDEKNWLGSETNYEKYHERLRNLCKNTNNPEELMEKIVEISIDSKYSRGRFDVLVEFGKAYPGLIDELKEKLFTLIKENKHSYEITFPLEAIGAISNWYRSGPCQKERENLMELLIDPDCHLIGRVTSAYFLRNVKESDLRDKVKTVVEDIAKELLVKYEGDKEVIQKYGTSKIVGFLVLSLKVLDPSSPVLESLTDPGKWKQWRQKRKDRLK